MTGRRRAGLASGFPACGRSGLPPRRHDTKRGERLAKGFRQGARDSRILVRGRPGPRIRESREGRVDILTPAPAHTRRRRAPDTFAGTRRPSSAVPRAEARKPPSPTSRPVPRRRSSACRFASRHESTGSGRRSGWPPSRLPRSLPPCSWACRSLAG